MYVLSSSSLCSVFLMEGVKVGGMAVNAWSPSVGMMDEVSFNEDPIIGSEVSSSSSSESMNDDTCAFSSASAATRAGERV